MTRPEMRDLRLAVQYMLSYIPAAAAHSLSSLSLWQGKLCGLQLQKNGSCRSCIKHQKVNRCVTAATEAVTAA
jgi:hypothetical protein